MRPITITKTANVGRETKNMSIIGCLGSVISAVRAMVKEMEKKDESDELSVEEILLRSEKEIDYVGEKLSFSQVQVIIMAACLEKCTKYRNNLKELSDALHINYLKLLEFNDDLEDLKRRGFMTIDKDENVALPKEVLEAFRRNETFTPEKISGLTTLGIVRRINDLFKKLDDNSINDMELCREAEAVINENPDTSFSKTINGLKVKDSLIDVEEQLLLFLACRYYCDSDDLISRSDIEDAFAEEFRKDNIIACLHSGSLDLIDKGVVEFVNEDGMMSRDYIHICDDFKESLFGDSLTISRKGMQADIIKADRIVPHELFYDSEVERQVGVLRSMLSAERYGSICDMLKSKGLRTGFSCIFYGAPGTGKTETVKQLARECSRDLMMVDVSQLKSCWVGESEKNVKGLFDRYRKMVKDSSAAPILLFNEADAIFGIRKEGAQSAVDKMENSLQNIILQQMEDMSGILIATTNLTENLDKAFERRFLYKVCFQKPSVEAKSKIWKSMIPDLSDEQVHSLASSFDFSGGQIENISRKKLIKSVLDGSEPSFEDIKTYCSEENIASMQSIRRIGF